MSGRRQRIRFGSFQSRVKHHVDSKAAAGSGERGNGGVVCDGDLRDDGQAEPDLVGCEACVRAEPFERFEEPVDLLAGISGAGIGERENGTSWLCASSNLDPAAGDVVANSVRHEVGDKSLE